ncbi:MAG: undecaprenyl/decaprenyl-phosphate alpha-N-acetylglucosaminyl 1-phosphate transferase [Bacteroidia bacterium]|jgi:UDP-GlcNAc:undecaprenyl-phosphate GlcNAc-1-phosphate transferase|nr:undecaprenyl/decaprenyl-phosphate alpha-N-acetylglucosaminyl 1-phosphate transferase [Bacteroidia bacterium]
MIISDSFKIMFCIGIAMCTTAILIPCWIKVCAKWNLYEQTDDRKQHRSNIPTMGGISIFAGIFLSSLIFVQNSSSYNFNIIYGAMFLLFLTGFFDDLIELSPLKKVIFQFVVSILVIAAGFRIESGFGLFLVGDLPLVISYGATIFFIIAITNALNLIDGLDGLAGSITLVTSLIFGFLFYQVGDVSMTLLSMSVCGAVFGFLFYNFHPAKIFMGDTGSLVLGFLLAIQAIALMQHYSHDVTSIPALSPIVIIAALFVPAYDVLRVSVIRVLTGYSPFHPDRNHVHHMILGQGFGKRMTTLIITGFNLLFVAVALLFPQMDINIFLIVAMCLGMLTMNSLCMSTLANIYGRLGGRLYQQAAKA